MKFEANLHKVGKREGAPALGVAISFLRGAEIVVVFWRRMIVIGAVRV